METARTSIQRFKRFEHWLVKSAAILLASGFGLLMLVGVAMNAGYVEHESVEPLFTAMGISVYVVLIGTAIILHYRRPKCPGCNMAIPRGRHKDNFCGHCGLCFDKQSLDKTN